MFVSSISRWKGKIAPIYISELVSLKDTGSRYYLRSNDGELLNIFPSRNFLSTPW